MGFLWRVIRKYHVNLHVQTDSTSSKKENESDDDLLRKNMIEWTNKRMEKIGEPVKVTNLTSDFQNGVVLSAIVASFDPSYLQVHQQQLTALSKMRRAFAHISQYVPPILSAIDIHQV
jgi:hypothetical protein